MEAFSEHLQHTEACTPENSHVVTKIQFSQHNNIPTLPVLTERNN